MVIVHLTSPLRFIPSTSAAAELKSRIRFGNGGPRSLIRTLTDRDPATTWM